MERGKGILSRTIPRETDGGGGPGPVWCYVGLFMVVLGLFGLTSPGRIDIVDGQYRYEVAKNLLETGEPVIADPLIAPEYLKVSAGDKTYSVYNAAPSIAGLPMMVLSRVLPGHTVDRDRFAFCLTGTLFGAALAVLMCIAYRRLGLSLRSAALWSLAFSVTTLWWPGSTTVFDQGQHAVVLFASVLLAWEAGRRRSYTLAAVGGLVGGVLFNYQENYGLLLPAVGLALFTPPEVAGEKGEQSETLRFRRDAVARYLLFGACSATGLALFFAFNLYRFGMLISPARAALTREIFGDPVAAALSLLASPGKSVFLFSPPLVLALIGWRAFWARVPILAAVVVLVSMLHLGLVIQLAFFGGDWAWGPRYTLILLPLWALAMPFATAVVGRWPVRWLLITGLAVQLLAVSGETQRFFFERELPEYFWRDQWVYFKVSQLSSRPLELIDTALHGVPHEAETFAPTPNGEPTYAPFGPRPEEKTNGWVRKYAVFYLPRPWPCWAVWLDPQRRPFDPLWIIAAFGALLAAGIARFAMAIRVDGDGRKGSPTPGPSGASDGPSATP
jgi:hypothetical protein